MPGVHSSDVTGRNYTPEFQREVIAYYRIHGVNKTLAGATVGAATSSVHAVGSFCDPVEGILYSPVALGAGVFTGFVDGVGHVPAVQNCHYSFPASLGYAWWHDYRIGTADAQVEGHRAAEWNGGAYWPGGPR